ncbi:MAG: hypothetical protein MJ247_03665 [Alphaproteobacteria bacterium]|nr:hypothetical protein [Alphaproteobacteria bacterium]
MFQFLAKYKLGTRVYGCFLVAGIFSALVCFLGMFSVGSVQKNYANAGQSMEVVGQFNTFEMNLVQMNQSLFFFKNKGSDAEKNQLSDSYEKLKEISEEIKGGLGKLNRSEQQLSKLNTFMKKYQEQFDSIFTLFDDSVKVTDEIARYAKRASDKLKAMIDESTLPSASMMLSTLSSDLDNVLRNVDAIFDKKIEKKQLLNSLVVLKKSLNNLKQVEMINTKNLKIVSASIYALDDEINRKLKIDDELMVKIDLLIKECKNAVELVHNLTKELAAESSNVMEIAEKDKISLQKLFVGLAALSGIVVLFLAFASVHGFTYPLSKLVNCAFAISKGDKTILLPFTERKDEIGILARALSAVLARMKGNSDTNNELSEVQFTELDTKEPSLNDVYLPLGAASLDTPERIALPIMRDENSSVSQTNKEEQGDAVAYFGQGVGVDTESQLLQMLTLIQQISDSANIMSEETNRMFNKSDDDIKQMAKNFGQIHSDLDHVIEQLSVQAISVMKERNKDLLSTSQGIHDSNLQMEQTVQSIFEEAKYSDENVDKTAQFVRDLFEWINGTAEVVNKLKKQAGDVKILALNASIEANKAGDCAKAFGEVVHNIRSQTGTFEKSVVDVLGKLKNVQQGACSFGSLLENVSREAKANIQFSQDLIDANKKQRIEVEQVVNLAQDLGDKLTVLQEQQQIILPAVNNVADLTLHTKDFLSPLKKQVELSRKSIKDYLSKMPVYEEQHIE